MQTEPSTNGDAPTAYASRLMLIWGAIALAVVGGMFLQNQRHTPDPASTPQPANAEVAPVSMESEMTAKMVVALDALRSLAPDSASDQVLASADAMRDSPEFSERLGYSVLVGVVDGWQAGADSAKALEPATEAEFALRDRVVGVMVARAVDPDAKIDSSICKELEPQLGFIARVVCGDPGIVGEGAQVGIVLGAAVLWYALAFFGGSVILVLAVVRLVTKPPETSLAFDEPARRRTMLVLGETFALWMIALFALNLGAASLGQALVQALGLEGTAGGTNLVLAVSLVAFLGSLVALVYPIARGVRSDELRQVLGLHAGRGFFREAFRGVLCYFASVPLLVSGLIVFAVLVWLSRMLFNHVPEAGHPVTGLYEGAGAMRIAMIFLLASVAAPIVEETMFRGALYGHLRATIAPKMRFLSVLVAAVVSSAIFALIHPQGVLFAPALGGLAVGFCLFREARGSLVAPMVAHGINNAVTLTLGMLLMS